VEPLISIVTPSFNQAEFLSETILSVLGQRYARLQYVIMDGGSSDKSPEIIRGFSKEIHYWQSAPDNGQSGAINAGFGKCSGEILGWLNSDDFYLPGVFSEISRRLDSGKAQILAGNCVSIDAAHHRASYSSVPEKLREYDLTLWDYLIQPSTFWTRKAWKLTGPLDEKMRYAFDWDWFIRAKRAGVEFISTESCLAAYRIHSAHKTGGGGMERVQELAQIYERYHGLSLGEAFLQCSAQKNRIQKMRSRLRKWRMSRLEGIFLRAVLPSSVTKLTARERDHLFAMM
jgi:glycosyltransferase involved in cell wall biosynthesis